MEVLFFRYQGWDEFNPNVYFSRNEGLTKQIVKSETLHISTFLGPFSPTSQSETKVTVLCDPYERKWQKRFLEDPQTSC